MFVGASPKASRAASRRRIGGGSTPALHGGSPAIPPGESDDAPDGLPAAACTIQAVHEVHGLAVVLVDGDSEPQKVAFDDLEKLEGQLDDGKVVPFPGAASLEPADAEQVEAEKAGVGVHEDAEPTVPPAPTGERQRSLVRMRQRVVAAEAAAKRATAKFMNLARQLAELEQEGT